MPAHPAEARSKNTTHGTPGMHAPCAPAGHPAQGVVPAIRARRLRITGSLALASLLLAGCGMKGPLYMPEPPPPADEQLALPPDVPLGSNPTQQPLP
ncbi:lipoprotein [Castellaniella sp.]|uniref:LPS translocon maturation chaperone LptM n=1 Tax=Castellaniella sp. TaxID=1955812 RepID=UPI0035602B69